MPAKQIIQTKSGRKLTAFFPTIVEIYLADRENEGFCIHCGAEQSGVEPDASRYKCESCGKETVYGAAECALRGFVAH